MAHWSGRVDERAENYSITPHLSLWGTFKIIKIPSNPTTPLFQIWGQVQRQNSQCHNVRFTGSFEWRLRGFLDKEGGEFISQGPQPLLWYTIQLGNLTRSLLTRDGHLKVGAVHCCGECWTEIGLREPHPPVDRVFQGCQPPDVQDEAGCCQVGKKQK